MEADCIHARWRVGGGWTTDCPGFRRGISTVFAFPQLELDRISHSHRMSENYSGTRRPRRELNLKESLLVLIAVAVVGVAGYGGWQAYLQWRLKQDVQAAWPIMIEAGRTQRDLIVEAIEAYRARFGFYPPEHVISRNPLRIDPVTNTLVYELGGTTFDPTNRFYKNPKVDHVSVDTLRDVFQIDALTNAVPLPGERRQFLSMDGFAFSDLHDDPDLSALQLPIFIDGVSAEVAGEFAGSSWRYVHTTATNNPGKFDVWMVLKTADREAVIGNWPAAK